MNNHDSRFARHNTNQHLIDWFLHSFAAFFIITASTGSMAAQTTTWRYIVTLSGGAKLYLNDEIKTLSGGNKAVWQKAVNSDASANISLSEWNCAEKKRRTLQITLYNPDGSIIETNRNRFEWTRIIPGSTGEVLHRRLCQPAVPPPLAEISVETAFLRALPDAAAPVSRATASGTRFEMVPETGKGGWFNVVDAATQEDYWLQADDFIVLETPSPPVSATPQKVGDRQVKRGRLKAKAHRKRRRK